MIGWPDDKTDKAGFGFTLWDWCAMKIILWTLEPVK